MIIRLLAALSLGFASGASAAPLTDLFAPATTEPARLAPGPAATGRPETGLIGRGDYACSSSTRVPRKSLGWRNSTGLSWAPILGLPSPSTRAPVALS